MIQCTPSFLSQITLHCLLNVHVIGLTLIREFLFDNDIPIVVLLVVTWVPNTNV